jgi:hypothetical protein
MSDSELVRDLREGLADALAGRVFENQWTIGAATTALSSSTSERSSSDPRDWI